MLVQTKERRMDMEAYRSYFSALGVKMTQSLFRHKELLRLQQFRNAIVHQGGEITSDNIAGLNDLLPKKQHFELGDHISATLQDVESALELVGETCRNLGKQYVNAVNAAEKITSKT